VVYEIDKVSPGIIVSGINKIIANVPLSNLEFNNTLPRIFEEPAYYTLFSNFIIWQ
jgi:hypothetical protein